MTIWKYELASVPVQGFAIPEGAKILTVQVQSHLGSPNPAIWALVDESRPFTKRYFATYGTGQVIPDDHGPYVGSYQCVKRPFIFHVFEITELGDWKS